jgi:hypothetical protein
MLKKIVLVAALAVASFASVSIAAHQASTPTPANQTVAAKYPPDCWGVGCSR